MVGPPGVHYPAFVLVMFLVACDGYATCQVIAAFAASTSSAMGLFAVVMVTGFSK